MPSKPKIFKLRQFHNIVSTAVLNRKLSDKLIVLPSMNTKMLNEFIEKIRIKHVLIKMIRHNSP